MTLSELIAKAKTVIEEDMRLGEWKGIVETVLRDLNSVSKLLTTEIIPVTLTDGCGEIDIEDEVEDFYEMVAVHYKPTDKRRYVLKKIPMMDTSSQGWNMIDGKIQLHNLSEDEGDVYVSYYKTLSMNDTGLDVEFNLPERYHETLLKGVMAIVAQKEEELERKADFFFEYTMGKRMMLAERMLEVEPWYSGMAQQMKVGG